MLNIVIPMAGRGSRFAQAGYTFPKPLIDVDGFSMIELVINSLIPNQEHQFIFICQQKHLQQYDIERILSNATKGNFRIVTIPDVTAGAAVSVLAAAQFIDNNEPVIVANADQYVEKNDFFIEMANYDGLIMTFPSYHPQWSYVRGDAEGRVWETAEKRVISSYATCGIYFFKYGYDLIWSICEMIKKNIRYQNEFYLCPAYNEMILAGKDIRHYLIPAENMHGLGTPEDLERFLIWKRQYQHDFHKS